MTLFRSREVETLRAELVDWKQRYDALFARYTALTQPQTVVTATGATFTQAPQLVTTKPERSEIDKAIEAIAGQDARLRRYLAAWADEERAKGESDETVIQRILYWERGEALDDEDEAA